MFDRIGIIDWTEKNSKLCFYECSTEWMYRVIDSVYNVQGIMLTSDMSMCHLKSKSVYRSIWVVMNDSMKISGLSINWCHRKHGVLDLKPFDFTEKLNSLLKFKNWVIIENAKKIAL
mgnify:CR=1 FL=1